MKHYFLAYNYPHGSGLGPTNESQASGIQNVILELPDFPVKGSIEEKRNWIEMAQKEIAEWEGFDPPSSPIITDFKEV